MSCVVRIPTPMRRLTNGQATVNARGSTVSEALLDLRGAYPDLAARLFNPTGQIKHHINIFVNSEDIRHLSALETPLKEGDVITLLPALAGG